MTSYSLDTNCLLRFLSQDILPQAKKIHDLMVLAKKRQLELFICEPVFIETAVMLKNYYKYDREKVFLLLSDLLAAPELNIEHHDRLVLAAALYREHALDFTDCLLLAYSKTTNHQLFSFYQKLVDIAQASG